MEVLPCPVSVTFTLNNNNKRSARDGSADIDSAACQALITRLEEELKAAKSAQLACGEVLIHADLLPRIASQILRVANKEPCGLRGCTLIINFQCDRESRTIGTIKCDSSRVSTFELALTLKQESRYSYWPSFLKNFTKGGTIVISRRFGLGIKRLYQKSNNAESESESEYEYE